jgi:quercetin dioxygenase-like cupin family protein
MKHQFLFGMMLAASLIIACNQKKAETKFESKTVSTPMAIVPESLDTLLSNGRRNIFLVSRRELPGLFVERSVFPPSYRSNPHTHPGDLNITVISGVLNLALTNDPDSATITKIYGAGSFVIIPANQPHFEWFTETTIMDITGIGPMQTINLPIVHSTKKVKATAF